MIQAALETGEELHLGGKMGVTGVPDGIQRIGLLLRDLYVVFWRLSRGSASSLQCHELILLLAIGTFERLVRYIPAVWIQPHLSLSSSKLLCRGLEPFLLTGLSFFSFPGHLARSGESIWTSLPALRFAPFLQRILVLP
jgi:hypothetical protein